MQELVKSMFGLSLVAPLFGARQLAELMAQPGGAPRVANRLAAVTRAVEGQLGGAADVFRAGDAAQRRALELAFDSLSFFAPATWAGAAAGVLERPLEAFRFFVPDRDGLLAWRELGNKVEVFLLVRNVSTLIGVPDAPPFPLLELVARAYALGPFPALWAVEGLGHDYADSAWSQGEVPHRLLTAGQGLSVPRESLLMLHAGVGLSIADTLLKPLSAGSPPDEVSPVVREIVALCRDNSRPGDVGAAFESLGLVTRIFHPGLVESVDRALRAAEPAVVPYFWHGVGRAHYFLPLSFLPCGAATWRAFEQVAAEAPDELARDNAVAGLAWALVLVNQRQPAIVAELLDEHGGELPAEAFASGVASSMVMRRATTPEAPFIASFLAYRPDPGDPALTALWDRLVRLPGEAAVAVYFPVLNREDRLGEVFRYQPLPALVAGLSGGGA